MTTVLRRGLRAVLAGPLVFGSVTAVSVIGGSLPTSASTLGPTYTTVTVFPSSITTGETVTFDSYVYSSKNNQSVGYGIVTFSVGSTVICDSGFEATVSPYLASCSGTVTGPVGLATATADFGSSSPYWDPSSGTTTLTVKGPPTITSDNSYTFTMGSSPNFTVTANGYPTPTISDPGPLDGLSIDPTSGLLSGTQPP